jgi:hypothetical protein
MLYKGIRTRKLLVPLNALFTGFMVDCLKDFHLHEGVSFTLIN